MNSKDRKNLDTFGDTNSINNLVKYPKIPANIAHRFDEYGIAENIIKHIFFYLIKQYQVLTLDTFLGQKWIDIYPETIAKEMDMSVEYLLRKTTVYTRSPYQCYQLQKEAIPVNQEEWTTAHKKKYEKILANNSYLYDSILADALYRMRSQMIEWSTSTIDPFLQKEWNAHYLQGFYILDDIRMITDRVTGGTKLIKAQVKLSQAMLSQIHLFFTLIEPDIYKKLLLDSKGHSETSDLYLRISDERNRHFFSKKEKTHEMPCILPFYELCKSAGIKYKKEEDDTNTWRYKEARKSLKNKLDKMVKSGSLASFEIEKVRPSKKLIDVLLYFNHPGLSQIEIALGHLTDREDTCIQKRLSFYYTNILIPGVQPWDPNITDEADILERFCNQEYYTRWLADATLHADKKLEAIGSAYTELGKKGVKSFVIEKKYKALNKAAIERLKKTSGIEPIKTGEDQINAFKRVFKIAYKIYFDYDYIDPELSDNADIFKWDLKLLYTFFACDHFKKKTMTEFSKNAGYIRTKVKYFCKGEEYNTFLSRYYKEIVKSDSTFFIDMDADIKDIVLEAFQKGTVTSLQVEIGLQLSHIIEADEPKAALNKANKVLQLIANTIDKQINVKAFLKPQKGYVLFPDEEYTIYPKRVN